MPPENDDSRHQFLQAIPNKPFIGAAREFVRMQLALNNRLNIANKDLEHLKNLPADSGAILISNHADEMDPRICLELARKCGKRFISMCNREAFDELSGMAGWVLQHLGHFSVERGAHDSRAKDYAIDVVKRGDDVLVIFPEGEIFYLNEEIQPFHSGAIEICMQALVQKRQENPNWTAYIVPMALKYHHRGALEKALEQRISKMELRLNLKALSEDTFTHRLRRIQTSLLKNEQLKYGTSHDAADSATESKNPLEESDLFQEIVSTEKALLKRIESNHPHIKVAQTPIIDQSWQLGAEIRSEIKNLKSKKDSRKTKKEKKKILEAELAELNEVAHLSSWRPHYYEGEVPLDRLSEVVLKLERELYQIKRPRQLTRRDVLVKISEPIDLGQFIDEYMEDSHGFRHKFTDSLHSHIQGMVDELVHRARILR